MSEHIDLFISYAFTDQEAAEQLAHALEAEGLTVWYAQSQVKAGHWRSKVEEAIDSCSAFLLLVSSASSRSNEVENEFRRAEAAHRPILVVYVEDCVPPLYAASLHAANYHAEPSTAIALIRELMDDGAKARRSAEVSYLRRVRRSVRDQVRLYCMLGYKRVSEGVTSTPDVEQLVNAAVAKYVEKQARETPSSVRLIGDKFESNGEDARSRVVLVGEPGAGKTSTLLKLLDELAEAAEADTDKPIPVLIPLRNYFGSRPFIDYVRDICRRELGDLAVYFSELLAAGRLALLVDGLNEIPAIENTDNLREIRAFLTRHQAIFVTVTCRVADYTPERSLGLDTIEIAPLTPPEIREFISHHVLDSVEAERLFWSLMGDEQARAFYDEFLRMGGGETAFWLHTGASPVRSDSVDRPYYHWNLWIQVRDDPLGLITLARNPYLLTIMIRVYLAKGRLPGNRHELFSVFFQVMYETGYRQFLGSPDEWVAQSDQASMLTSLAHEMLDRAVVTLTLDEALKILTANEKISADRGRRFLAIAVDERLLDSGEGVTFSHQLLREYFATAYVEEVWISGRSVTEFLVEENWWLPSGWEEAIILLAGKFADDPTRLLTWLRDDQPELTSQCIVQSGIQISSPYSQSLAAAWVPRLHGKDPAQGRAATGRALGRLHLDTRPGVCLLDDDGLPALEWATIAASKVLVGNVDHGTTIPAFQISRYLITNSQFHPFIADGGYSDSHRDCWTNVGWNWKLIAERQGPDDYTEVFRLPNHPRIGTVWYEAHAYCNWLTKRMRALGRLSNDDEIRLPTEAEWEAAARGPEGTRAYPWGSEFSYDRCNIRDIRSTSAVGLYQSGASPEGVYDLVGNAWSWCLTQWDDDPTIQNNDPEADCSRVYRGGSWAFDFNVSRWRPHELRCDQRYWIVPLDDRPDAIGFFVVKGQCLRAEQSRTSPE